MPVVSISRSKVESMSGSITDDFTKVTLGIILKLDRITYFVMQDLEKSIDCSNFKQVYGIRFFLLMVYRVRKQI